MYYPKNKIITNLYTNGNELVYKNTDNFYVGYYWETYEGKLYSGKSPENLPNIELEKIQNFESRAQILPNKSQLNINDGPQLEDKNIQTYIKLKKIPKKPKNIPFNIYNPPNVDDYKAGFFIRYFLVRNNESQFLELNKEIFTKIKNKDPEWRWELYTPFTLKWLLTGDKEKVYQSNKKITLLTEVNLMKNNFASFLQNNFLKYFNEGLASQK